MKRSIILRKVWFPLGAILLFAISILSCTNSNGTAPRKTEQEKLIYFLALADSLRQKANIPGVGIAIISNGETLYTGGLGLQNIEQQIPVDENTLFSIGSNTKAFTGVLAAKLVEKGKMNWHIPLRDYIPELELKEDYITQHVNLIDALNHMTGLGRHDDIWKYKEFPRDEILIKVKTLDFAGSFRSSFGYNNIMYTIAGIAMERASGSSYERLIQEHLFSPLGMVNSYVTQEDFENAPTRAIGYKEDGVTPETVVYLNHIAPAGSISSTPKDISKWIAMLINAGKLDNKKILNKNEYKFMMTAHDDIGFREPNQYWFYNAGIGGYLQDGKRNLGHSGSIDGQNSFMLLRPDDGFGIFLMTNKLSDYKDVMARYAQNIFVDDNYVRNKKAEEKLKELVVFAQFKDQLIKNNIEEAKTTYKTMNPENLESAMNQLGYQLLHHEDFEKAKFVFEQNTLDHPKSANVFDSFGEFYFEIGDFEKALENYEKSVELNEGNANAIMMIKKIHRQSKQ